MAIRFDACGRGRWLPAVVVVVAAIAGACGSSDEAADDDRSVSDEAATGSASTLSETAGDDGAAPETVNGRQPNETSMPANTGDGPGSDGADAQPAVPSGYVGRIKLVDDMDDPAGYCLDVPGPASNILLDVPAWAHSCHSGPEPDQTYRFDEDGSGTLHFLFEDYDLCLTSDESDAGSGLSYQPCDAGERQAFESTSDGEFRLRNTALCLSVINMEPGGSQDEVGTGRNVAAGDWVRALRLQPCDTTLRSFRQWEPIPDP